MSSITLKPPELREGQRLAMAGRLMPGSLRRRSMAMAISAPVLPQETATVASPCFTLSMQDHMDVPSPWRITWLGLSCMETTRSAWRSVTRPLQGGVRGRRAVTVRPHCHEG